MRLVERRDIPDARLSTLCSLAKLGCTLSGQFWSCSAGRDIPAPPSKQAGSDWRPVTEGHKGEGYKYRDLIADIITREGEQGTHLAFLQARNRAHVQVTEAHGSELGIDHT